MDIYDFDSIIPEYKQPSWNGGEALVFTQRPCSDALRDMRREYHIVRVVDCSNFDGSYFVYLNKKRTQK